MNSADFIKKTAYNLGLIAIEGYKHEQETKNKKARQGNDSKSG